MILVRINHPYLRVGHHTASGAFEDNVMAGVTSLASGIPAIEEE
jgi:hypothetical protein